MHKRFLPVVGLMALLFAGSSARADYQYTFADSSGTFTNNFNIGPSTTTVDIRVYLTQTSTGSDTTGLSTNGLNAAGVQLNSNNTAIANVTGVKANDTANGGPFNAVNTQSATGASAFVYEAFSSALGTQKANVAAPTSYLPTATSGNNSVYLGTFTFTGLSNGTTFTVSAVPSDPNFSGDVNVLQGGGSIDSLISNSTATIVVAIPEPGTLVLTGLFAAAMGAAGIRRFRRPAVA